MDFLLDSALLGLEYALLALGVFISFRILNLPDLTSRWFVCIRHGGFYRAVRSRTPVCCSAVRRTGRGAGGNGKRRFYIDHMPHPSDSRRHPDHERPIYG